MSRTAQAAGVGLFRLTVSLHTGLLIVQPMLAGQFLSGQFGMLSAHAAVGGVVAFAAMLQFVGAIALWWPGRRAAWPIAIAVGFVVLETVQLSAGYARALGLHLPLGVTLVAGGIAFAVWAWLPQRRGDNAGDKTLAGAR